MYFRLFVSEVTPQQKVDHLESDTDRQLTLLMSDYMNEIVRHEITFSIIYEYLLNILGS